MVWTRHRLRDERGFTLIELLVVMLILGALAAIALPAFLGQRSKGQDAAAKSDARNLVSHVESCFTTNETYLGCDTQSALGNTGLTLGSQPGQVTVTGTSATTYTITAYSNSGASYTIAKDLSSGTTTHVCSPAAAGGCPSNQSW